MQDESSPNEQQTITNNRAVSSYDARLSEPTARHNNVPITNASVYYADSLMPSPDILARESAARERMRRRRVKQRHSGGEWAWVIIAFALLGVVITISMMMFLLLRTSQTEQEITTTAVAVLPTAVDARSDFSGLGINTAAGQQITLVDGRSILLVPWDGQSRFTVLVVGLDRRPGETGLGYRTDTMMLVSIDPVNKTMGILSIPRDLYVEVPGYSELQRINTPMVLGELRQPGYGPELLMQTVQYNLGIRVHDYIAVDFNTFITVVDSIGGIDIELTYNIYDPQYPDMYYGYDPFRLNAGQHHLDGATALKYARTRHGDSDFRRAERQQQVIYAIRDRILNLDMLPQLIINAPTLWDGISEGVSTGLTLDQMIQLAWYLKDITTENIHTGVINEQYTIGYSTPGGASVLVPDRANIGPLMVDVFGANYSE